MQRRIDTFALVFVYRCKKYKVRRNFAENYKSQQDTANPNISFIFGSAGCILFFFNLARKSPPWGQLWQNMTSSTKPEVHNIWQRRQRRTEPRPCVTSTEHSVTFGHVVPKTWAHFSPLFSAPPSMLLNYYLRHTEACGFAGCQRKHQAVACILFTHQLTRQTRHPPSCRSPYGLHTARMSVCPSVCHIASCPQLGDEI